LLADLLVTTLAALGLGLAPPAPPAETIAFVRGNQVFTARVDGTDAVARLRTRIGFTDVAFDGRGRLYASEGGSFSGDRCDVRAAGRDEPIVRFGDIVHVVRSESALCHIARDSDRRLIFAAGSVPEGGESVWRLDPASRRVAPLASGHHPTMSGDGRRLVVVQHRTRPGGGTYETLAAGTPGRATSFSRIVPVPPKSAKVNYAFPSLSPDGQRLAALRVTGPLARLRWTIVVGRPGGQLRPVWGVNDRRRLGRIAWPRGGRALLVYSFDPRRGSPKGGGELLRVPLEGSEPTAVLDDLTEFALRLD